MTGRHLDTLGLNDKSKVCAENTDLKIINKCMVIEATVVEEISQEKAIVRRLRWDSWKRHHLKLLSLVSQE